MLLVTSIAANIAANSHKQLEIGDSTRVNRLFSARQCIHEGFESRRLSHKHGAHRRVIPRQFSLSELPAPSSAGMASGKFVARAPKTIHAQLAMRAKSEGVSLNTLVLAFVAEGLGRREHV